QWWNDRDERSCPLSALHPQSNLRRSAIISVMRKLWSDPAFRSLNAKKPEADGAADTVGMDEPMALQQNGNIPGGEQASDPATVQDVGQAVFASAAETTEPVVQRNVLSAAPDAETTQASPPDSDNVPALPEENLSVSPNPAPTYDPSQDLLAESSEPAAPADPPPADAPDNVCVPGDDTPSSPPPDQPAAEPAPLPPDEQNMLNIGGPD